LLQVAVLVEQEHTVVAVVLVVIEHQVMAQAHYKAQL
tara:strand:+ start:30 stop:140 length:111 start_codon:yes stop_codon:yes gene_type:complete